MKRTVVCQVAGRHAALTTTPAPPWHKQREHSHLQKFKEFQLGEFPWVHSHMGFNGRKGAWVWGDAKELQAERKLQESRYEEHSFKRYAHPDLPAGQDRVEVPAAAAAVLASHLRGRPGGYGLAPETQNIPHIVQSERPEFDAAKKDEPRTARGRWAQYRNIDISIAVADLALSKHATRRLEAAYGEYIHEGALHISASDYEDFWDNYERAISQLNIMVSDAKKADIHPKYRPMEQYKVRENGHEFAMDSLKDWQAMQVESLKLGERYKKLKDAGADSVTGPHLYDTPALAVFNTEKAARKKIQIKLTGMEHGYQVDKVSVAMSTAKAQLMDFEEEEEIPDHLHDREADGSGMEAREAAGTVSQQDEDDFRKELGEAFADEEVDKEDLVKDTPVAPSGKEQSKKKEEKEEDFDDLFSDFVNPDDK